jgi:integrase
MASTPQEARRLAELCAQEIEREALTVDEAIDLYTAHLRDDKCNKEQSCKATAARLRLFFQRQRWLVRELTPSRCANLYSALVKTPSKSTGQPLRPDTHRNYLAEAKTFLGWCVARKMLRQNPLAEVRGVGRRSHGKEQLTTDEARKWLATALQLCSEEDGAIAAALLLLCGLRCSEVTERVVRDVGEGGRVLRITRGKTRAAARPVAIPEVIRPYVLALCKGQAPTAKLFGQHWRDWPRHWVKRICAAAGVPDVCAHSMRGLHATLSVAAGMSPHLVAASLGHESPETTLQSYAAPGSAEAAASRIAQDKLQTPPTRH